MVKIALMSSWNAACGISIHAELIGREWIKQGHDLKVFAPLTYEDDHTYLWFNEDESFVTRNFSFLRYGDKYIHRKLFGHNKTSVYVPIHTCCNHSNSSISRNI